MVPGWFLDLEADFLKVERGDVFLLERFVDRFDVFDRLGIVGDGVDFGGDLGQHLGAETRAFVDVRLVFPDRLDHAAAGLEDARELALDVSHALLYLLRPHVFVVEDHDVVGDRRENRPSRCLTP